MKSLPIALIVAISFATLAHAEDALTVGDCIAIYNGLNALDHATDPITGKQTPNNYKVGGATYPIARDLNKLQKVADASQQTWNALAAEVGHKLISGEPETLAFQNRFQHEVYDRPCNVSLEHFSVKYLRIGDGKDENAIPFTILSQIAPLLSDFDETK